MEKDDVETGSKYDDIDCPLTVFVQFVRVSCDAVSVSIITLG